jgi:hypothetical protein
MKKWFVVNFFNSHIMHHSLGHHGVFHDSLQQERTKLFYYAYTV